MFYLYIIYSSKLDRYYVGYTADIEVRIVQHNSGLSSFTSKANDASKENDCLPNIQIINACLHKHVLIYTKCLQEYLPYTPKIAYRR
jgi:hypothetical protein